MQDNNSSHNNRSFNGFLIGLIFGAVIVFLFATKRGKKILKLISEEGLDNITNVLENMEDEEMMDQDFVEDGPESKKSNGESKLQEATAETRKQHRFFKRGK
ncbi:MAG: hypothetical protein CO135_03930 [Candidatus Levybacteria bacterium CG_4_9_14_3_um_filter_35_16]|nr:MAG: hypothetical protein COW87_04680 [Candidatus Levybacteria bacterium CG22_combo_CG10-13_8_21_14_all_35_11]PIZ99198.1 MAG: hypothetical protein COX78_02135 [Candidatus Levybacteria bacterium CG_4_10_14_0_2_um_filter_35_8]PJA90882.1 MAG: hypothetical protein CO135_03930 [Candidatus Levybacteria bacterium CG_4_9_14_3_um_filter_35_16]PJC54716.1 MAG: hypothetical protein CO028_01120 [Candidatus Levybacteria bacterium CG_4_9_14_0_2_um_filter_35_21]